MKQKIKRILEFTIFLCILLFIFSRVTYLFREVSLSRNNITGFDKEGDLDVVCVGASTVVEYYQPLTAWNEYGYTSYAYGTLYGQMELFWRYMDRVLETQNPKLFVVDLRMMTTLTEEGIYEQGLRFWSDSLPILSADRYFSLRDYFKIHSLNESERQSRLSYYLDIAKYHTNDSALASPDNWMYMNNRGYSKYKGYEISSTHHFYEKPAVDINEKAELSQIQYHVLYQLLNYCKEKDLNVLFVVCPYIVQEEEQRVYNTMKEIVTSYGYHYINANECYDEIGLDFQTDLKNINHVNCVGAEKYTRFLAGYIIKNYEIQPHENDESYAQWDKDYDIFAKELEKEKEKVYETVQDKLDAVNLSQHLAECEDFYEWTSGARNDNYTVLVCADLSKCSYCDIGVEEKQLLENWGIDISHSNYYLQVSCGGEIICLEDNPEGIDYSGYLGVIDGLGQVPYNVQIDDSGAKVSIGDKEYIPSVNGISFILVDNNLKKVFDSVILYVNDDGSFRIER